MALFRISTRVNKIWNTHTDRETHLTRLNYNLDEGKLAEETEIEPTSQPTMSSEAPPRKRRKRKSELLNPTDELEESPGSSELPAGSKVRPSAKKAPRRKAPAAEQEISGEALVYFSVLSSNSP